MGKRSDFKRVERDYYRTWGPRAVASLLPHLPETFTAWEPCAGDGSLVSLIGRGEWYLSDIEPRHPKAKLHDAFTFPPMEYLDADLIITNPPWSRHILHPMIDTFRRVAPTWLLFDADWAHTRQSAPLMPYCRKIVSVGRIRWIEDSKMDGKDNCAWYLFDREAGPTRFYGRTP